MQFNKFKSLASTLMKKNLIVTITVVTAISLGILTGCGAYQQASADPLTNPTQIEQMVEDEYQETEASGDVSEKETQETTQETTETSSEQAERQNQDADHTEQSHNDSKPSTETTESKPSTEQAHTHTWVTETRYKTVHHDAITHTEQVTITDQAAWDETQYKSEQQTIHHDAVTHDVYHEGGWVGHCRDCGAEFTDSSAADAHCINNDHLSGYTGRTTDGWTETIVDQPAYDETVTVQVPYTVHHDAITHVETRTVVDKEAYNEQVPYTVTVCSECGKEK